MKMLFKQRLFSWFDSYDVYDESDRTLFTVKGQLAWGHCLKIFNASGEEVGMVKERVLTLLPKFELYRDGDYVGCIAKEFSLLHPRYNIDFNGWHVEGSLMEWDYSLVDRAGLPVAQVTKELFHWTDTYVIDVYHPQDALCVLMFVLAIDAEKCSRSQHG